MKDRRPTFPTTSAKVKHSYPECTLDAVGRTIPFQYIVFLLFSARLERVPNLEELVEPFCVLVEGREGGVSSDAVMEDNVATLLPEKDDGDGLLCPDVDADEEGIVRVTELGVLPSDC